MSDFWLAVVAIVGTGLVMVLVLSIAYALAVAGGAWHMLEMWDQEDGEEGS